ncbi:GroES-like protein [Aspergillus sclerotiicarbonarius CBS 121057]|uniref:GroES-like protein n=1 Tax=Aspergillus sclerotiicarbonarius (strain CBS 121057 / IBT 28362) TaxID=1448318 RepID=A0A319DZ94_ASPSB|nr:GroES-like protein [Aspergillus sclerotiicarbonarius CBS 121057]
MPINHAAIAPGKNQALVVQEAPYPTAGENRIVVRVHALAVNAIDYAIQMMGETLFPWITFPLILGEDVAGEVVAVGPGVTRFQPGDRVVGQAVGTNTNNSLEAAFQQYVVLLENMTSTLPAALPYEQAAVIPLAFSTAIAGLFQQDYLGLQTPSLTPIPTGKTLLIWGGATSVGSNAIQLAVAAGYEVIATSSPHNFDYVRRLGATAVFDYKQPTIRDDLREAFRGKTCAGALAIAGVVPQTRNEAAEACLHVVAESEGDKFVALSMPAPPTVPDGVACKFIFASTVKDNEVSHRLYGEYLPAALAHGSFVAAPEPEVVGTGLEAIQGALDTLKQGVSAKKLVMTLP